MAIGVYKFGRIEFNIAVQNMFKGWFGQLLHFQEPLEGKLWLYDRIGSF
jgi:hypothetical protein